MINDLDLPGTELWKYVDDTIAETIEKNGHSNIQETVDDLKRKTTADRFKLNKTKFKELRISFSKSNTGFDPIIINN